MVTIPCPNIGHGGEAISLLFLIMVGGMSVERERERERERARKDFKKISLLPLLHVQGKKRNNAVQNGTVSSFSFFYE
jgi:hypothetical protein